MNKEEQGTKRNQAITDAALSDEDLDKVAGGEVKVTVTPVNDAPTFKISENESPIPVSRKRAS